MVCLRTHCSYAKFPQADKDFIKRWLDWADANYLTIGSTQPIAQLSAGGAAGGKPGIDRIDGVAAFNSSDGFVWLFNPGPTKPVATLTADGGLGIKAPSNNSKPLATPLRSWIMYEIYPREELDGVRTPLGIVAEATSFEVSLRHARFFSCFLLVCA